MADSKRTSRQEFMDRVRSALGRKSTPTEVVPPPTIPPMVRLADHDEDIARMFEENAVGVGMEVIHTNTYELRPAITKMLSEELDAKHVVIAAGCVPQAIGLNDAIRRKGIRVLPWRDDPDMKGPFKADVGITDTHAALAETGTLVCCSDQGHSRGLTLAPSVHMVLLRKSDIVPDMMDYIQTIDGLTSEELPSAQAFITGPSKTADIEGVLITGVHGPARVIIFLINDA